LCGSAKPCLVSCSVLKKELEKLVKQGDLDVDLIFVSKYFHVDYTILERNLRKVVEKSL
jgi:gluconate kinase